MPMLIVDGHEDLAFNVLVDGRDYLQSAYTTRVAEEGGPIPESNGLCMLGLPEWLAAGVGVIIATITAIPRTGTTSSAMTYANAEGAHQQGLAQLNIYRRWETADERISIIANGGDLDRVVSSWPEPGDGEGKIGLVLLIENADLIRRPDEVRFWYEGGVRLIGPAWNANRYTANTEHPGPLTDLGRQLLAGMAELGMILDLSHMADEACVEALATYDGPIVATHANPRRVVPRHRMIPDETIKGIIARDGVVGIMPANWAVDAEAWGGGKAKEHVHVSAVVDAIDVVCQLAGDARHAAIGTDFDGGFGAEATPAELDTIADLPRVAEALRERGYDSESVAAVMSENWLRVLRGALPA